MWTGVDGPGLAVIFVVGTDTWTGLLPSGLTVATTLAQSAFSSAPSLRAIATCRLAPFGAALGKQNDGGAACRHAAGNPRRLVPGAPEGVEAIGALDGAAGILGDPQAVRLGAIHGEDDGRAERHEFGIGG